jgi:hypothetical protein
MFTKAKEYIKRTLIQDDEYIWYSILGIVEGQVNRAISYEEALDLAL